MRRALVFLFVVSSCQPQPPVEAPAGSAATFEFGMKSEEMTRDGCVAGDGSCTYVRVDYPTVIFSPSGAAVVRVEAVIRDAVNARYMEDGVYRSPTELMRAFLAEYAALVAREPSYRHPWFLERKVFVVENTPEVLSLSVSERAFTGGAHGSQTIVYQNLHPSTGEPRRLADWLVAGFEPKLRALAEAKFREVREIEDGTSLEQAGFIFFEDQSFSLTNNYSLSNEGVSFYYNAYEVGPYALGPTEIHLSAKELEGLIKE